MNKPKNFKTWRIVGIVVTALLIIGGFVGAYALGVSRGADMDGDWSHPMSRFDEDAMDGEGYPMPMSGYGRNSRGMTSGIGGIFGFFIGILIIGAFIRLVFFPMRMARRAMWAHRYQDCPPGHNFHHMPPRGFRHGPHGPWDEECCGEKGPEQDAEETSEESYSKE